MNAGNCFKKILYLSFVFLFYVGFQNIQAQPCTISGFVIDVAGLTPIPIPALMLAVLAGRPPGILVSCWVGANAAGLSVAQWALLIAGSVLLALLFLFYGEQLEEGAMSLVDRLTSGK